jgi:Undecaprenyl-phosphate galactose phosphotransferase WbaP
MTYIGTFGDIPSRPDRNIVRENVIHLAVFILDVIALMTAYHMSQSLLGYVTNKFQMALLLDRIHFSVEVRLILYSCLCLVILFSLYLNGHYSGRIPWWSQLQEIGKVMFFAAVADSFTNYAFGLHYPGMLIATNWLVAFCMIVLMRIAEGAAKSHWPSWKLPAIIIANADIATDALYAIVSDRGLGLSASAILLRDKDPNAIDREELPANYRNINILTGKDNYEDFIAKNPHYFYIVSLDSFRDDRRDHLIGLFQRNSVRFSLLPPVSRTGIYQSRPRYFFGNDIVLLDPQKSAFSLGGRILKRSMDLLGAAAALAIFLIPMLVVALMLKLEGQDGTALYAGTRVGRNGRLFRCYKFRTMQPGTDHLLQEYLSANPEAKAYWDRYFKLPNDPRVQTRTARFIRKASIDELPQLWNVLTGDMSLVGPRPILENEIDAYGDQIDAYTSMKPGITGLWQASGRSGTSFQRRVAWDSWYIRNWSLLGDIIIILKTIRVVLSKSGAS